MSADRSQNSSLNPNGGEMFQWLQFAKKRKREREGEKKAIKLEVGD